MHSTSALNSEMPLTMLLGYQVATYIREPSVPLLFLAQGVRNLSFSMWIFLLSLM